MKRALKSAALASLMALGFAGPMAIATAPTASARDHSYYDRDDRDHDRRDDRRDGGHRDWDRHGDRRDWDRHGDHRDWDRRSDRRDYRYDRYAYNGYRGYERHYWRRGEYVPRSYWGDYRVVDYRYHHLRAPPRGYHYRYDRDRDEYLLVGVATGFILGVIAAH